MEKDFLEVFPGLKVDGDLVDLLDTMQVTRVGVTRKKDWLRYMLSAVSGFIRNIFSRWRGQLRASFLQMSPCR